MATDDVYILATRALFNSQEIVNTWAIRWKDTGDPVVADFTQIASALKEAFRGNQVDDLAYTDWVAQKVRGSGVTYSTTPPFRVSLVSFTGSYTGTLTGVSTNPPVPNQCAALLALNTSQSGRRRKGRVYIAGLTESVMTDASLLDGTFRTNFNTSISTALAPYFGGGSDPDWELGVWSDRTATNTAYNNVYPRELVTQGAPDPDSAFAAVVSVTLRSYIANQRRRRPGV